MRVVVALGGNALYTGMTPSEERSVRLRATAVQLADLIGAGHELVITHGNGPQVGERLLDREARMAAGDAGPENPLDVLVAMTQAEIGYRIQRALGRELANRGLPREVVAIISQVVVNPTDPAFAVPTKPVGPVLTSASSDGVPVVEVPGGWRRVVASPAPLALVEVASVKSMLEAGAVPICAGGGGIPVVSDGDQLLGVEAVVDKDASSALLACDLDADALVILTDVDAVQIDFGTDHARALSVLTTGDVEDLFWRHQAPSGSMGPKLLALVRAANEGREAVLGPLGSALDTLEGRIGTRVLVGPSTGVVSAS
ncbi:MAG: carbamate kinase [Glaciecola sp.]|jgi:carbamate kinase